ncbi:MAG: NAD(P)H-dependent oxidoreductase subunit E [Bacteroidia bacterium]|nr:NAD(P)H-dependent oxidoreductase subunit E [Bacteroidia bacterium]
METTESKIQFKPESLAEIDRIIKQFPEGKQKSALIRILHIAQHEFGNWLSVELMDYIADLLKIKPIEVYEVASFYSMYNLNPVGKVVMEVCHTGPCCLVGVEKLIKHIENTLNIKPGETTADGMFTLKTVECLGACGYGPMMQIGETYHEKLNIEKLDNLLSVLRQQNS